MAEGTQITSLRIGQLVQWNRNWLHKRKLDQITATYNEEPGVVRELTGGGAIIRWANGCEVSLLRQHLEPVENGDTA